MMCYNRSKNLGEEQATDISLNPTKWEEDQAASVGYFYFSIKVLLHNLTQFKDKFNHSITEILDKLTVSEKTQSTFE